MQSSQIMPVAKVMSAPGNGRVPKLGSELHDYYRHPEAKYPPTLPVKLVKPRHLIASHLGQLCGKI